MSIQLPVILWTIVCFAALYLILKYLLFRPVLNIMDKRQKKIDDARNAKETADKQQKDAREKLIAEQEEMLRRSMKEQETETDKIRTEGKQLLEDARKQRIAYVDSYREKTEAEYQKEMESAEPIINQAAEFFVSRLFAD